MMENDRKIRENNQCEVHTSHYYTTIYHIPDILEAVVKPKGKLEEVFSRFYVDFLGGSFKHAAYLGN